ncbi:MAG: pilus assembly protein [Methylobacillus sp.]|jgi:type IV pilus assembly protein PilX|nr:pilus assembly protein [Methylobacillus sp.]
MRIHSDNPIQNYRHSHNTHARIKTATRQRGVSLFVVMVVLLLALILVLGGVSVSILNESLVGNQSDQQRAYAAAEALIDSAQRDIRLNNGLYCLPGGLGATGTNATLKQGADPAPACTVRYPANKAGYAQMLNTSAIVGTINTCAANATYRGVCISDSPTELTFQASAINNGGAQLLSNGAGYNQFTASLGNVNWGDGASAGSTSLALGLGGAAQNFKGAYWVEIFLYNSASGAVGSGIPANVPVPDSSYPFIFRITALAQGLRGGTVSVLRTYYVPYPCIPSAIVGGCS